MIDLQWVKSSTWQSGPYGMTLEIKGNFIGSGSPATADDEEDGSENPSSRNL